MGAPVATALRILPDDFRAWWAQRRAVALANLDIDGLMLLGVCARQTGKTVIGTMIVVGGALEQPGGQSCVAVPTYRIGLVQARRLRELGEHLGGRWRDQKSYLELPNKHVIWLRSADDPDSFRGLTITGWLWGDEATLMTQEAWRVATSCQLTGLRSRALLTCTPRGKQSWVYRLWSDRTDPAVRRFTCQAVDSPYISRIQLERNVRMLGEQMAAQELRAIWTDDGAAPFPPELVERLLAKEIKRRGSTWVLGVDIAKEEHWCVVTAMNEWGESFVVGRWQHLAWPSTWDEIEKFVREWDALLVIDRASGAGSTTCDEMERRLGGERVIPVNTNMPKVHQQLIEEMQADAQHGRISVDNRGPHVKDLRHELLMLTREVTLVRGAEVIWYKAPSEEDHCDTVISLALANAGRRFLENPDAGILPAAFMQQPRKPGGSLPTKGASSSALGPWGKPPNMGYRA